MNTTSSDMTTAEMHVVFQGQPFWETRVHDFLFLYISPVIILFGTLGNILSLVVLQSRHYKSTPTTIALSALALADIAVLNTGPLRQWIKLVSGINVRLFGNISCKIHFGFTYLSRSLSGNILALTSLERVLCVWFPLRVGEWVTKRRMLIAVFLVTIVYLLCHLPLFIDVSINTYSGGDCFYSGALFALIWRWADFAMYCFIPFLIILVCNALIIIGLRRAAINRKKKFNQEDKKTSSTTVMLVVVGVVFLLTISPSAIFFIGVSYRVWPDRTYHDVAKIWLAFSVTLQLSYINNAVNFLLYCCTGTKFRQALGLLFRTRKESGGVMPKSKTTKTSQT